MLHCTQFLNLKAKECCKSVLKRKAIKNKIQWKRLSSSQEHTVQSLVSLTWINHPVDNCWFTKTERAASSIIVTEAGY